MRYSSILLFTNKNKMVVKYALSEDNKTIIFSKFRLTLSSEKNLLMLLT